MTTASTDFLIIGGGIIGLALALEARERHPGARVKLIEKEPTCGRHASGRNSGVLHAGFYYAADSLKARFTREGNQRLTDYCLERGLRIRRCGKLVVARDEADLPGLDELLRRAKANGVDLSAVTEAEARRLEPRARTCARALYSPTTSSVDSAEVVASLVRDAQQAGIAILSRTQYLGRSGYGVRTTRGVISAGYVINAAGLYADRIARDYGFSADHCILPFRGLYLYAEPGAERIVQTHIYPVPELQYPFLGVHFTVTVDGRVKIGPTAIPALWREHYRGLGGFRTLEFLDIAWREAGLLSTNRFGFRTLAWREVLKHSKRRLLRMASELVTGSLRDSRWSWGPVGVRAQLVNTRERRLEMDFRCEGDDRSFHVLNAVSPGFTCALPFASHVFDEIDRRTARSSLSLPVERADVPAAAVGRGA